MVYKTKLVHALLPAALTTATAVPDVPVKAKSQREIVPYIVSLEAAVSSCNVDKAKLKAMSDGWAAQDATP